MPNIKWNHLSASVAESLGISNERSIEIAQGLERMHQEFHKENPHHTASQVVEKALIELKISNDAELLYVGFLHGYVSANIHNGKMMSHAERQINQNVHEDPFMSQVKSKNKKGYLN